MWLAGPAVLTSAAGLGIAFFTLRSPEEFFPLGVLALLSLVLQMISQEAVAAYGFTNLAFYVAVMTTLAPSNTLFFKEGLNPALIVAGRWACGALVLMMGTGMRFFSGVSFAEAVAYAGANAIRWIVVGLGLAASYQVSHNWFLPLFLPAIVGAVLYAVLDSSVINSLMRPADPKELNTWERVLEENRATLPVQVFIGALAAAFAANASPSTPGAAWAPLALSGLFAAPTMLYARSALKRSIDGHQLVDQEELENDLRKLRYNFEQLDKEKFTLSDDVAKKKEELTIIYDLARSLGSSTDLDETTQLVQSMIRRLRIPYQSLVIFLSKPGGNLEPTLAETPYNEVLNMSGLLQLQEPFILQVLRDPRPYMNNEVSPSTAEQRIFKDERSILVVPLMVSKENVGIIYLGSVNPKTHKEEHLEKLKMLAAFAAPSIKTSLLFELQRQLLKDEIRIRTAVEAKNIQLKGLQQLGAAIGASLKIENTFRVVAEALKQMVPGQSVILFAASSSDPSDHLLKAEFMSSPYSDFVRSLVVRSDEGILGRVTEQGRTLLVADTEKDDLQNFIVRERSVIVAPLRSEEELLGLLYVGASQEGTFTAEHCGLVETVSYQASIAMKNARLYEQTQQMAFTDGLTGLYLHRFFQVRLTEEIAWADRYKKSICLVMVDTDHFKKFNDTLGHPAGDALLQEIAALLKDKARPEDIVCRYGGDEFALILKDLPKDKAFRICDSIRETFQLRFAASAVQVTSSIGLACYPTDAANKKDLAKAADDALYVSKREGRNRVSVAPTLEEKKHMPDIVQETLPR
jgi:diguanylate cyclase (GGDEF)-like protein